MKSLKQHLIEGRNDPSIFHAVFMAGAPGAGKSFVADSMALPGQLGYKEINSDIEFTRYMRSSGLADENGAVTLDPNRKFERGVIRTVAKRHTNAKQSGAMIGRLGLVIDGTGADSGKLLKQKKMLESLGYECAMVYVNLSLDGSIEADRRRGLAGDRTVGPELITTKWKELQSALDPFRKSFGNLFFEIDNSAQEKTPMLIRKVLNVIVKWSKTMPKNKAAKKWMDVN